MGYTPVKTVSTGDSWTARDCNIYFRDNFAAGIPGLMAAKGDLVLGSGADASALLSVGVNNDYLLSSDNEDPGAVWSKPPYASIKGAGTDPVIVRNAWTDWTWMTVEENDQANAWASAQYTIPVKGYYFVFAFLRYYSGINADGTTVPYFTRIGIEVDAVLTHIIGHEDTSSQGFSHYLGIHGADILEFESGDVIKPSYYIKTKYHVNNKIQVANCYFRIGYLF